MWRSLVARVVRDDEVAGSNPVTPTKVEKTTFTVVFSTLSRLSGGPAGSRSRVRQRVALTGPGFEPSGAPRPHPD